MIGQAALRKTAGVSWGVILKWGAAGLLLTAAIAAFVVWNSPIGARYQALQMEMPPVEGVNDVLIQADSSLNHVFSPAAIRVPAGTTVTWHFVEVDEDGNPVEHNVIFEGFGSDIQAAGTYTYTFNTPGTYRYVCTLHPFMEGEVIVVE